MQPLFATLVHDFARLTDKQQEQFWTLGAILLGQTYKGTVFDSELKLAGDESEDDNFDVALETAEKIYILRPILRPGTIAALEKQMRVHCLEILNQVMTSFLPEPITEQDEEKKREQARSVDDSATLGWLKKYVETNNMETSPEVDEASSQQTVAPGKKITLTAKQAKRRLKREESGYDQKTKTWKERNSTRTELIAKACSIFDYIVDFSAEEAKISTILAHLNDYEKEWTKFPRTVLTTKTISVDKLGIISGYH